MKITRCDFTAHHRPTAIISSSHRHLVSSSSAMDAHILYIEERLRGALENAKKVCVLIAFLLPLIPNASIQLQQILQHDQCMLEAYEPARVVIDYQQVLTQFFGILQELQRLHREVDFSSIVPFPQSNRFTASTRSFYAYRTRCKRR